MQTIRVVSIVILVCVSVRVEVLMAAALPVDCASGLDRAVQLHGNGEADSSLALLQTLDPHCEGFPQVAHNLGVLAAGNGDWETAIEHLERSLDGDARAAMSLEHLRRIHRYQAGLAWSEALDTSLDPESRVPVPTFELQNSSLSNSEAQRIARAPAELRSLSTVEYELFDWWQSARSKDRSGWFAHYAQELPAPDMSDLARHDWDDLTLEIRLAYRDAVAVILYPSRPLLPDSSSDASQPAINGTLLLLRLEGNRWKIYEQSPL